jgi:hypothetical protein
MQKGSNFPLNNNSYQNSTNPINQGFNNNNNNQHINQGNSGNNNGLNINNINNIASNQSQSQQILNFNHTPRHKDSFSNKLGTQFNNMFGNPNLSINNSFQ